MRLHPGAALLLVLLPVAAMAATPSNGMYGVDKGGTVDINMVETTPVVWRHRLIRLESVRGTYPGNVFANRTAYFRFRDVATGTVLSPPFGLGYAFGCATVVNDTVHVFGSNDVVAAGRPARSVIGTWSTADLQTFKTATALSLPDGYTAFNTNVAPLGASGSPAHPGATFVMAIELGAPASVVGTRFTMVFALTNSSAPSSGWDLLPPARFIYTPAHYSACPTIRYVNGQFYMAYLNVWSGANGTYAEDMARSPDLAAVTWEESALAPFLVHSAADATPAFNAAMNASQEAHAAACASKDIDASDIDWVEVATGGGNAYVYINYNWGDQQNDCEFLGQAVYHGSEAQFLTQFF